VWLVALQVAEKYVHLVTAINNADTLVTLIGDATRRYRYSSRSSL